jgi:hypothetical protein
MAKKPSGVVMRWKPRIFPGSPAPDASADWGLMSVFTTDVSL